MTGAPSRRAAQYLRVSSDQQRYSLAGQSAQVAAYAERHGFQIVRTYQDAGVSGVTTAGRKGLRALLADVVGGQADYDTVLVYDVSRWGRFQNPDEAAHYEFVCRQEGVAIVYCAEPFEEGGVTAVLLKQVKRVTAAEYSRHLSRTIAGAKRRYAGAGCWQGGVPSYGLRRALIGANGEVEWILEPGRRKPVGGGKVALVLGPPEERAVILRIYSLFIDERVSRSAIVRRLRGAKVRHAQRRYAEQGYWLYGEPGYGLARQAEGREGKPGRLLERGERNPDRDCRTRVVLGPPEEVAAVRLMFRLLVDEGLSAGQIAAYLNQQAIASPAGATWSAERVREILTNPKYAGDLVTQRRTTPLGGRRTSTASAQCVVASAAGPALVSRDVFDAAREKLATPPPQATETCLRR